MTSCIYCGNTVDTDHTKYRFFCNLNCKNKFLVTDYKTHPIWNTMKSR